jgi:hypothetical protein
VVQKRARVLYFPKSAAKTWLQLRHDFGQLHFHSGTCGSCLYSALRKMQLQKTRFSLFSKNAAQLPLFFYFFIGFSPQVHY